MADGVRIDNRIDDWARRVEQRAVTAMMKLAGQAENVTRQNRAWRDDTWSAQAAITGYLARYQSHTKNYDNPSWKLAQRKGGIRWPNPPENYYPDDDQTIEVPDDALTVIVTHFVKYGLILEEGWMTGGFTFFRSFEECKDLVHTVLVPELSRKL